jgi:hypothetical protein
MRNRNILKGAVILLIVSVLLMSNLSVMANTSIEPTKKDYQTKELSNAPSISPLQTFNIICEENFTDGNIPPEGVYGDWTQKSAGGFSWKNCSHRYRSAPLCAVVKRGNHISERNEWLITPSLNFSKMEKDKKIYLDFSFMGNYFTAIQKDYVDYFVNVSIDNGTTWNSVWNEDSFTGEFTSDWADVKNIDLSHYAGNNSVLIGFQFITYSKLESQAQYLYLDDISVHNETDILLPCSHGGPYEWWWYRQKYYTPEGVRFHGGIDSPYKWWECRWEWDFGDGNYSNSSTPFAIHFYDNVSDPLYNITLKVTHPGLGVFRELKTTLWLFEYDPGPIDVKLENFSVGVKAKIENLAVSNATYVNWTIEADWGLFGNFHKVLGDGMFKSLEPNKPEDLQVSCLFLKLGIIKIIVTLIPENMGNVVKIYRALKIGPALLFLHEI